MEVDRVGRMGSITPERTPAWTREGLRRRRFALEVEPEVDGDAEDSPEEEDEHPDPKPDLDVMA